MNNAAVIVMAAGASTRFKSKKSKILHNLAGKPAIEYLSKTLQDINPVQTIFVLSHQREQLQEAIETSNIKKSNFVFTEQKILDGTAGAVRVALEKLDKNVSRIVVIPGDTPLIPGHIIKKLVCSRDKIAMVAVEVDNPEGFGRVIVDGNRVRSIIEETDLDDGNRDVKLVNASIYAFDRNFLVDVINKIKENRNKKEYYLTDIIELASSGQTGIECIVSNDVLRLLGANDRVQFAQTAKQLWIERAAMFQAQGVEIMDNSNVYIDDTVKIDTDAVIYQNVYLKGDTHIAEDVQILEGSKIVDSKIARGAVIGPYVYINGADIGENNNIGPFTYIRPGTKTSANVKVGGFVETKKVNIGAGTKVPHLSYVGDTDIGKNTNIGCGVITCNYDGVNKSKTVIGDNVFIGSDSQLIAPLTIGDGAYVAAGTTVTNDVPGDALAISRQKQTNKASYASRLKQKALKKKEQA